MTRGRDTVLGKRRRGRNSPHFTFRHQAHMSIIEDDAMDGWRKPKTHEAHMIPGVDGSRIFGFPNSIITKLRYCTVTTLTGTGGARALNAFAANGIYDPDITGVGHQPMYRDTYASIYNHYKVLGSKITVTWLPRTGAECLIMGIAGGDDASFSSTPDTLREQNNSISRGQGPPGSDITTLTATFEPLSAFGVDVKDDGASTTPNGANPTELWCWGVWAAAANGSSTIVCDAFIEIEYTVKFAELVDPTQS